MDDERLSNDFTLAEMVRSKTAERLHIWNHPTREEIENGRQLCLLVLQPVRERWGPLRITSGFRTPVFNQAIHGRPNSDHQWRFGAAADFIPLEAKLQEVFDWVRLESGLPFDQVVLERGRMAQHEFDDCIHISWRPDGLGGRRQAFLGPTHNLGSYESQEVRA